MGSVYNKLGGGKSAVLTTKSITANGTYDAASDNADGYSEVNVAIPLGTKSISANGTYNASSDSKAGYSQVTVNVNQSTEQKSINSNGTYTPSSGKIGFSKVTVNVPQSSRVLLDSSRHTATFNINLSGYSWVYLKVTDDGSTNTNLLLQVGGDWAWAGGYWSSLTQEHKSVQQLKATTTQIVFGSGDNMAVTAVYGISNLS